MTKKESALVKEWQSVGGRDCGGWAPKARGGWEQCDPKTIPKGADMREFKIGKLQYTKAFKQLGGAKYREVATALLERAQRYFKFSLKPGFHGTLMATHYEKELGFGIAVAQGTYGFTQDEIDAILKIAKRRVKGKA